MLRLFHSHFLNMFHRRKVLPEHMPESMGLRSGTITADPPAERETARTSPLTLDHVDAALRTVIDPELGYNLVDLGLIYGMEVRGSKVIVHMTLTTRGCPLHESLIHGVRRALLNLEPVDEAEVQLVWDPPWHPSLMSPAVAAQIGGACAKPLHSV
jgi:metal-sulfur cluster biosynthetic enzyme